MKLRAMTREEVREKLQGLSVPSESGDGDIISVVYESFRAQAKGLNPHPKSYTGVLKEVRETKSGELVFVLKDIIERNGEIRSFNPDKGWVLSISPIS